MTNGQLVGAVREPPLPPSMEDGISISAVIPTYNRGHLVGRAIDSVLRQSRQPSEVLVVDDGSQDDTRAQVLRFGDRVRYVYQPNAGASSSRNYGVREAASEWIAFLDSDDLWLEAHLEHMVRAVAATSGAGRFYFADTVRTPAEGGRRLWEMLGFVIEEEYAFVPDASEWVMMRRQPMMLQSTLFNRQAYLDCGGLWDRLRTRHDTHLFLKMGLGSAACAVAGCGAQMTDDDLPGNRVTSEIGAFNPSGHWQQVWMYKDLLSQAADLPPVYREELRRRLSGAHLRLAHIALNERHPFEAARQAVQSALVEPLRFLRGIQKSLGRV